jgi:hypothetical protein
MIRQLPTRALAAAMLFGVAVSCACANLVANVVTNGGFETGIGLAGFAFSLRKRW